MTQSRLHQLSELGQSVWVDFVSRETLRDGETERLIREDAVVGMTSNPTIFQKALAAGDDYDEQLREVVEHEDDATEVFLALAQRDIQDACDLLHDTYERTGHVDGFVSIEVSPAVAEDGEATLEEARKLHRLIDRPNLFVKIPAVGEGVGAIEDALAEGIPINVTLIFGLERYRTVAEAYLRGLERLVEGGGDPSGVPSVASFFVSRVDTEADKRLDALGGHDELKGKLAIANAKLAYAAYREIFTGDRWEALKAKGATPQRCLWASTSVKDPSRRDTLYVEELIGPETVNTMPPETIKAFQDHGEVAPTLEQGLDEAREVFAQLEAAGVDYDEVIETLEREGVEKFTKSFDELIEGVEAKREEFSRAPAR